MKQVAAEFQSVLTPVDQEIVVHLKVFVITRHESRRISHRAEQPRGRDLRETDISKIVADPLQSNPRSEVVSNVQAPLATIHSHVAEPEFVQHVQPESVSVAHPEVARRRIERSSEAWDQRLLLHTGAKRLNLVRIERAIPYQQLVGIGQSMINTHTELVNILVLRLNRGQVLEPPAPGRERNVR